MKLYKTILLSIVTISLNTEAHAGHAIGTIDIKSNYAVSETIDRLESALKKKGMTIFKRISHSEGARKVDMTLRDAELLIFGNPKAGTPLMQCQLTVAIDLPQKALAYKDEDGQVWLSYNDPAFIANRHHITGCDASVKKISKALETFSRAATQ